MSIATYNTSNTMLSISLMNDFSLYIEYSSLVVVVVAIISMVLVFLALIFLFPIVKKLISRSTLAHVDINFGGIAMQISLTEEDKQIAYNIWVELCTRKIGLEIDFEDDVIVEIYNSWYSFFLTARNLIGSIPVEKIEREGTFFILENSLKILNKELRSHLTHWQARYRKWYAFKSKNDTQEPQVIQREYPKYDLLVSDMKRVNKNLIEYRKIMYKLATNKEEPDIF